MQARLILGAIGAVLLQVMLAPNIAILGAQPNFIAVYAIIIAMVHPSDTSLVIAFATGLVFDALAQQAFGIMPLILVVSVFVFGRIYKGFTSNNIVTPLVVAMLCSLLVEILYAGAYTGLSETTTTLFEAITHRAIPGAMYDSVAVLLIMPLLMKTLQTGEDASLWNKNM